MRKFDVCVIGGGPSGYAAAIRAVDFGKKTLLVEKRRLGGAAVFNGALSSKTLWELSNDVYFLKQLQNQHNNDVFTPDFAWAKNIMKKALNNKCDQLVFQIQSLNNSPQIDLFYLNGTGVLEDNHIIKIFSEAGEERVYAENIILATGSKPRHLPHIKIDEEHILTSDGIHNLNNFPESMVILGAGVIGCEFATIFSNFGQTKVNLIDKGERILPFEDDDVTDLVINNFENQGVNIHKGSILESMEVKNGRVEYILKYNDGHQETHHVEKALLSVGRVPVTENLGIDKLGINCSKSGHIIDNDTQTNIPNIYAVGDLTADIALVNVGELEGRHAIEKIYGKTSKKLNYSNISTIMFLNPEISAVGMNEQQAQKENLNYKVASYHYQYISRAIAMRHTNGFFKIIVTDDEHMTILGMRALGMHSSSAIEAVSLLISMEKGIEELTELIHPHPSITEGIQECVRMLTGKSIMKPEIFKNGMRCERIISGKAV